MREKLVFRKATKDDISVICELRKAQLIDEGAEVKFSIDRELEDFFKKFFEQGNFCEFFACDGEKAVASGAVIFYDYPPSFSYKSGKIAYITNMYTAPEYRKRGIATKLLGLLQEEAKRREVFRMRLGASTLGRPVYEKFGFEQDNEWLSKKI